MIRIRESSQHETEPFLHDSRHDTCLDFFSFSRNDESDLRRRSFIDYIRDLPGIGETSGRFVSVNNASRKSKNYVCKYMIGLSSDESENEGGGGDERGLEMGPSKSPPSSNQFLTVGRSSQ